MQNKTKLEVKYKDFIDVNNSETIVILHGWGWSSNSWVKTWELLKSSGFNVIIPDLPWFWETKLNYIFDLDEYAKIVTNFLRELKINDFILWWHSNWWAISVKIANSHIFKIKKLVLNNSAWIRNDKKRSVKRKILNFFSKIVKKIIHFIPSYLRKVLYGNEIRKIFYKLIGWNDYLRSEEIPFLKETYLNIIKNDISEAIKKIDLDTLLIWWEKDTFTPLSDAYFMRKNIIRSKLVIMENETHWIHIKNPNKLVDTFLKNI